MKGGITMIIPKLKSQHVERLLKERFGVNREKSILDEVCVEAPIGCGKPITNFRTEADANEYEISGLCQSCQDELFD